LERRNGAARQHARVSAVGERSDEGAEPLHCLRGGGPDLSIRRRPRDGLERIAAHLLDRLRQGVER
jgi:hypothetical protein